MNKIYYCLIFSLILFSQIVSAKNYDSVTSDNQYLLGNYPYDLRKITDKNKCIPVNGFYNRMGLVFPPYVYGFNGDKNLSATYWCEKVVDEKLKYFLIFVERERIQDKFTVLKKCKDKLIFDDFPDGLYLEEMTINLEKYFNSITKKKNKSKDIIKDAIVVVSEYDGVGFRLYCHNNEWLITSFH